MNIRKTEWLDVCYILKHDSFGRVINPKNGRPAIILSDPKYIQQYGVAQVIYLTRGEHCSVGEVHPLIKGFGLSISDSIVRAEQICSVDSTLIGDFIAELPKDFVPVLISAILKSTNLLDYLSTNSKDILDLNAQEIQNITCSYEKKVDEFKAQIRGLQSELDSYRESYLSAKTELEKQKKLVAMYRNIAEEATLNE